MAGERRSRNTAIFGATFRASRYFAGAAAIDFGGDQERITARPSELAWIEAAAASKPEKATSLLGSAADRPEICFSGCIPGPDRGARGSAMNAKTGLGRRGKLVLSALGALGITAGCDLSAPPLTLDVGRDSAGLWVRNRDAEPVANCRVVLNGNWTVTGVQLRAGVTEHIAADRFDLPGGRRLDDLGSGSTVAVTCHEPEFRSGRFLLDR